MTETETPCETYIKKMLSHKDIGIIILVKINKNLVLRERRKNIKNMIETIYLITGFRPFMASPIKDFDDGVCGVDNGVPLYGEIVFEKKMDGDSNSKIFTSKVFNNMIEEDYIALILKFKNNGLETFLSMCEMINKIYAHTGLEVYPIGIDTDINDDECGQMKIVVRCDT